MKYLAIILLLSIGLVNCGGPQGDEKGEEGSGLTLPDNPEKIEITYHDGGGMMDLSSSAYISLDSCTWDYRRNGHEKHLTFSATETEVRDLYQVFYLSEFQLIESKSEGEVYDRGGVGITLQADDVFYDIDNSGSNFIETEWKDNWQDVSNAITEFVRKKQDDYLVECFVKIDESILSLEQPFNVGIDGAPLYNSDEDLFSDEDKENGFKVFELAGATELDLNLYYSDSLDTYGGKMSQLWISEGFNFSADNNVITFYLEDGRLAIK